jgi:serine/threonine protein kinase
MDDYEIIRVLGRGAYGEVILAKQKIDNELCAIKILEKSYLAKVLIIFNFLQ